MNAVNCSLTSKDVCDALNRESCDLIPNTCGPCVGNYIGIIGDANSYCFGENESPSGIHGYCIEDKDCFVCTLYALILLAHHNFEIVSDCISSARLLWTWVLLI
jgi:hypothetical protein